MDVASINSVINSVSLYIPLVILIVGNVGCLFNVVTFTSKELRRNSCGWYFLMSTIFDFALLNFGLISKVANDHFDITLNKTSSIYCKIRIYITWTLPCISSSYLVLATLDRYLSTSRSIRLRSFNQIRMARRVTCLPIILYSVTGVHQLFYFDLRPICSALPGTYSILISIYSIVWTSLIPQGLMLLFGCITYKNVRKSRQRLGRQVTLQLNTRQGRIDTHLIIITLSQVVISSILLNIRTVYYSYTVLSTYLIKSNRQLAFEALLLQLSSYIFYFNFSKSFFINTLTSRLFRQVLCKRLRFFFSRVISRNIRIHPTGLPNPEANRKGEKSVRIHLPTKTITR